MPSIYQHLHFKNVLPASRNVGLVCHPTWVHFKPIAMLVLVGLLAKFGVSQGPNTNEPSDVTIARIDGQIIKGKLSAASHSRVTLQMADRSIQIDANDIGSLSWPNKLDAEKPPVEIQMMDGSRAYGEKLLGKSPTFQLQMAPGVEILVSAKAIRAAKLKPIAAELEEAWQAAIKENKDADAIVVPRPGNTLDRVSGVIAEIKESEVAFEMDGQSLAIPFAKLVGFVWFQRNLDRVKPAIEVTTTNHSLWMAESFSVTGSNLDLQTPLGMSVSIPLTKIQSINYSAANIRWLSEVESLEAVADQQIEFNNPVSFLERAFAPRFTVKGKAPTATSIAADKDLYFPSPGRWVFRVPEGFTAIQTTVVRTDTGTHRTDLTIEVWQDDERISQLALPYTQDTLDVNVPVKSGKKVKLVVSCTSKLMIGTEVQWKQPRLKR